MSFLEISLNDNSIHFFFKKFQMMHIKNNKSGEKYYSQGDF